MKTLTYLWIQWALLSTQYLWINTPPHQCPMNPSDGCNSSKLACQPNSPSLAGEPNIILGFLDIDAVTLRLSEILVSVKSVIHRCEMAGIWVRFFSFIMWYLNKHNKLEESVEVKAHQSRECWHERKRARETGAHDTTYGWVYQVWILISITLRARGQVCNFFIPKGKVRQLTQKKLSAHINRARRYVEVQHIQL